MDREFFLNLRSKTLSVNFRQPSVLTWNRLEGRPRTMKFDRSLKAEIRDPLWMLTRQWQFGEFKGEDAGSAIFTKIKLRTSRITQFASRDGAAMPYDEIVPLETRVEQEEIPVDILLKIRLGYHWFQMLKEISLTTISLPELRDLFRDAYPIKLPAEQNVENALLFSNRDAWQTQAAVSGRAMDGWQFFSDLADGTIVAGDVEVDGRGIPDPGDRAVVTAAGEESVAYFRRLFNRPPTEETSPWAPEHLEYQFRCAVPNPDGSQTVLRADEYYQGHLDWYAFDSHEGDTGRLNGENGNTFPNQAIKEEIISFIPTEVRFSGMPNLRWWEFEDGKTDLGDIDAHTTELAKLLFAEFGLVYGNDWSVVPYVVPVGSLCEIQGLAVKDVFGQRTLIKPAGSGEEDDMQRWSMFTLSSRSGTGPGDNRLFLPPALDKLQESPPIEKITFLRDEMANMVWAVESIIPNQLGGGVNGYEAAVELLNYLRRIAGTAEEPPLIENEALIRYLLATTVPFNWIPFIPMHIDGSNREIQLQRAAMPRVIPGLPTVPVEPRGEILRPDLGEKPHYNIFEEEAPRSGAIITRTYQRTRWHDGSIFLWLGRRKINGRGEGSSGLKFDQIVPKEKIESESE